MALFVTNAMCSQFPKAFLHLFSILWPCLPSFYDLYIRNGAKCLHTNCVFLRVTFENEKHIFLWSVDVKGCHVSHLTYLSKEIWCMHHEANTWINSFIIIKNNLLENMIGEVFKSLPDDRRYINKISKTTTAYSIVGRISWNPDTKHTLGTCPTRFKANPPRASLSNYYLRRPIYGRGVISP